MKTVKHACDVCGASFDKRQKLGSHRFKKHGIRVAVVKPEAVLQAQESFPAQKARRGAKKVARRTAQPSCDPSPVHYCPRCGLDLELMKKAIDIASKFTERNSL